MMGTTCIAGQKWKLLKEGKTIEVCLDNHSRSGLWARVTMGEETGLLIELLSLPHDTE